MLVVITPATVTLEEMKQYAHLLEVGLQCLHLRLPGQSREVYEDAILTIPPRYRHCVVICDHFELAEKYGLGGIHLRKSNRAEYKNWAGSGLRISTSAHSVEELKGLPFRPTPRERFDPGWKALLTLSRGNLIMRENFFNPF